MCKLIAELVGTDPHVMKELIQRLERSCGEPGVDLRLTGEIYGKLHMKMRELGLDPNDTTPHELYGALMSLATKHDEFLATRLGIQNPTDPTEVLPVVAELVQRMRVPKQVWAIKSTTAKQLLKTVPPKTLIKVLGYRSLDSMLKRESISALVTAARHLEPATWQQKFTDKYKKLKTADFEARDTDIQYMASKKWQKLGHEYSHTRHTNILHTPEVGGVIMLPVPGTMVRGMTLASLLLVLHYLSEVRMHSTYLKFHHLQPDFAHKMVQHLTNPNSHHAYIAGQPIHWRVIHRYYGSQARELHPEVFQPHVQPEDMAYRRAEQILYRLEPALHFWHDLDYVALPQADGSLISFNLMDVAINIVNGLNYEHKVYYHVPEAVWTELYSRYVGQQSLERQLLQQLGAQELVSADIFNELEFAV